MDPVRAGEVEVHRLDVRAQRVVPARPGAVVVGRQTEGRVDPGADSKARAEREGGVEIGHERPYACLAAAAADGRSVYGARADNVRLEARVDVVAADDELRILEARHARRVVPDGAR